MKLFAALENQDVSNEVSLTTKSTENEITVYANIGDAEGFKQALIDIHPDLSVVDRIDRVSEL